MRLATVRVPDGTRAVRVDPDGAVDLGVVDVGALLQREDWIEVAGAGRRLEPDVILGFAPVVPRPGKIICVGLNYRTHILEMGRPLPEFPTLFAKYPEALVGPDDPVVLPPESDQVDWEGELALVVGTRVHRADEATAGASIAGFAILNDVTMRDWQYRSPMWLQGKTWDRSTPFGPYLVTPDELPGGVCPSLELETSVNGERVQNADTADLVFDPVALVRYVSTVLPLNPGDVIATGTPGGVGHARTPARYLKAGDVLTTTITGLGESRATAVALG